jgi:1,4-dihydroxy-6-naphthoate synthase
MTYSLAYSPCPNDTYIFAALTNGLLPAAPQVEVVLDDVEALNVAARAGRFELTKVSYGAIPYLMDATASCAPAERLGAAAARSSSRFRAPAAAHRRWNIFAPDALFAIPGRMTTAYALLRLALGHEPRTIERRFDGIVDAVARGEADAGLIIHESRFTYQTAGLAQVVDLGEWWERYTGKPIPLGAILVRNDIPTTTRARTRRCDPAQPAFARAREAEIIAYVRAHAFEMDESVMRAHIALYVNDYSDDVGADGIAAVEECSSALLRRDSFPPASGPRSSREPHRARAFGVSRRERRAARRGGAPRHRRRADSARRARRRRVRARRRRAAARAERSASSRILPAFFRRANR